MPAKKMYSMLHEKEFITKLGSFIKEQKMSRVDLLHAYIETALARTYWDGVDKNEAISYARECLRK